VNYDKVVSIKQPKINFLCIWEINNYHCFIAIFKIRWS